MVWIYDSIGSSVSIFKEQTFVDDEYVVFQFLTQLVQERDSVPMLFILRSKAEKEDLDSSDDDDDAANQVKKLYCDTIRFER